MSASLVLARFRPWHRLAGVLSDENRALLRLPQAKQPRTVLELAELSGRAASNLSRTLRNLEDYRLVWLHRSPDTRAVRRRRGPPNFS